MSHLSYVEAVVMGAVQGVAELFPISSLGHAILIPALVGGQWARDLNVTAAHSPYLAFVVGLHVATALALLLYYRRDWATLLRALVDSIRTRRIAPGPQRLIWLVILATVPVGVAGLLFDHLLRSALGAPIPVAVFLAVNGVVLIVGQRLARRAPASARVASGDGGAARHRADLGQVEARSGTVTTDDGIARLSVGRTVVIGAAQIAALFPGISRSGSVMVAGQRAGLSNQEAARFSFLLATPAILAAGLLELPSLAGPSGHGILGQVLVGSATAFIAALAAVRFLDRYFANHSLVPFAIYCVVVGAASATVLALR